LIYDYSCFCLIEFIPCIVGLYIFPNTNLEHWLNVTTLVGVWACPFDYFFFYCLYENDNLGDVHQWCWLETNFATNFHHFSIVRLQHL
jgi:hypothetical protein